MVTYRLGTIQQITGGYVDQSCIYIAENLDREIRLKSSFLEQLAQFVACFDFEGDCQKSEFKDGERKAFPRTSINGYCIHDVLSNGEFVHFVRDYNKEYDKLILGEVSQIKNG